MLSHMPIQPRPRLKKNVSRCAAALAALLVPALLAACGAASSPLPPALAPTQPSIAPGLPPPSNPGSPARILPGQRPFATPPPFTLPRAIGGGTVSLSDYAGKGPIVVIFYRGYF